MTIITRSKRQIIKIIEDVRNSINKNDSIENISITTL